MVLGMVTGSVPMLFSLLLMQGITLTMWRSFLDKAIPRYNGDKFRQNIEQVVASAANLPLPTPNQVPASAPPDPGSQASILMANSMPSSTSMDQQSSSGLPTNSIAHSLQILSKLDPSVIQLLNTLSGKKSEPSAASENLAPTNTNQQPKQPLLNSPMDELTHTALSMSEPTGLYGSGDLTTNLPQFVQYGPNGEPMQYMPADQANQPDYAQLMQQYQYAQYPDSAQMEQEGIDPNSYQYQTQHVPVDPNVQYQYTAEGEQPDVGTTVTYDEGDTTEVLGNEQVEQAQETDDRPDEAVTAEEEPDKEMAEDRPHMPQVIIGPPISGGGATHGSRGRRKKKKQKLVASEWPQKLPKRRRKSRRMFGKPRVLHKRMLNFEPISKKFQQTKQRISRRLFTSNLRPVRTTTYRPKLSGPYRFATPRYPIPLLDSPPRKDEFNRASIERPLRMESRSSMDTKMGHISVAMSNKTRKTVKLKSNKIRLFELDDVKSNCSERSSKGKFAVIWSQKSGWPKNSRTGCNSTAERTAPDTVHVSLSTGLQKGPQNTVGSQVTTEPVTSTTTIETLVSTDQPTTTIQSLLTASSTASPSTEVPKLVSTEPAAVSPSSVSTTQSSAENNLAQATAIPSSFLINFSQFLASLTTVAPSIPITPTTTTAAPSTSTTTPTTEVNISPNLMPGGADELPKEFLYHVLMAINASKIDDFQVHSNPIGNDLGNAVPRVNTPPSRSNEADLETEEDEDEDEENQVDWRNVADEDTRVDGKNPASHRFKRVCYYLLDGGKDGQLDVSQLELHICSHLIVGYARISTNGLVVAEKPLEDSEKYRRLTLMKLQHPKLKVLLSVGDLGGNSFSIVASSNRTRQRFAESVLDFCDEFNFDGIDIDWEFPSFRTGYKEDKTNFILLLDGLRARSNQMWRGNRKTKKANAAKSNFLISVAVGAPLIIASTSYIIPAIAKVVDFVNLQSYDFHTYRPDRPYTGHHAPLYPRSTDQAYYSTLNVAWAATYWANNGMPLRKIIVGVPTYARTYNLVVPVGQNVINAPANGPGLGRGKLNYAAVCQFLKLPGAMKQFDIYSQVPYAYRNYDWIAYENEMSVAIKAQWVIKTGMGGIVTFALNFDDSKGTCRDDGKKFPLQKTISNLLELASIKSYKQSSYVMKIRY